MAEDVIFADSRVSFREASLFTGRSAGRDIILLRSEGKPLPETGLTGGQAVGNDLIFPASYENMLTWERQLAPARRLVAINQSGYQRGFGAGNRIVLAPPDVPGLRDQSTFGGWDGIFRALLKSAAPFWFVQQSIVRELIPEGVNPAEFPGIGHTGGYGPRELLRAGLFAFASQGGYTRQELPIGADADHAIVTGRNEEALARSLALNKLAMEESRDYTKFTVDTCHLFDFAAPLDPLATRQVLETFRGRRFEVPNILPDQPPFTFEFGSSEIMRLGQKYWRACAVHKELYDLAARLRGDQPFDYELALDETPQPMPPRELLFYLVLLHEVMALPAGAIASAGPNIGFTKRHDYEADPERDLWPQVNACASILAHFGAMLSVHSADGVRAATGKGIGVDEVIARATGGRAELKVADVYQEVLWQIIASSEDAAEREVFVEAWRRTVEAVQQLAGVYTGTLADLDTADALRLLTTPAGLEQITADYGAETALLVQGVTGYGLPLFKLAADLEATTDPDVPDPDAELFRRFMFLTFRSQRPAIFRALSHGTWERFAEAVEEATLIRLRAMGWAR